ncbi:MAG: flippase-like domain-containing protein [Ignavibacteriaceae bacterium]|nr:flippase-like domain-containing protein [Ignavibacteriaceae bacterium]
MTSGKFHLSLAGKRILNYGISIVLTVLFLFIAFNNVNVLEVIEIVSHASLLWIAVYIIVLLASHYLRALRWKVILRSVKPNTSIKHLFGAIMVGYGVNCVVPRLGEISRPVILAKWEGLSRSSMFGTVIFERIVDIIFLGLALIISLFIWQDIIKNFPWLTFALYASAALMIVAILFIYLTVKYRQRFYGVFVKILGKISGKFSGRIAHIFEMMIEGFTSLKGFKNHIEAFILGGLIMILYALSAYVGFFLLGMERIQPVSFSMAWVLMSISAIGVIIPTPGATGSYHTIAKSVLVLLFGFGETISVAYAFLTHIISYFLFIFTALIVFFLLNKQHDNLIKVVKPDLDQL